MLGGRTIRHKRFTDDQIIGQLEEAEAVGKTADLPGCHGLSAASINN
jgi:hypothetical protein